MNMNSHFNRYEIDATLAARQAQIRNDFSPRRGSKRHLSLPKLPSLAGLAKVRFHRPAVTA